MDVATGVISQLTTRHGPDESPVPSPDGRLIAYQGVDFHEDTYRDTGLYVMTADGSSPRRLAGELGRRLGSVTWAADGSGVYFNASMRGTENLWFVPLDGEPRAITDGSHMLSVSSIDKRGTAVGTVSSYNEPPDVVSFNLRNPGVRNLLTHVNSDVLAGVTLGDMEEIWYKSVGDYDIQGWIIKPPNFDPSQKYPLILSIHGGPHGQYNVGFSFAWQDHAANGYVVLYTNPRGSSGYGSEFGNAINNAYPGQDFDDLMIGVDEVIAKGYIDEDNMFVYGCSGGGVLTSWIVGHHGSLRRRFCELPGNQLDIVCGDHRRGEVVPQLQGVPLGRPLGAPAAFSPHVRGQRHDPHHAHDGRGRSPDAHAAD